MSNPAGEFCKLKTPASQPGLGGLARVDSSPGRKAGVSGLCVRQQQTQNGNRKAKSTRLGWKAPSQNGEIELGAAGCDGTSSHCLRACSTKLAAHIELATHDHLKQGISAAEAQRVARIQFVGIVYGKPRELACFGGLMR